MPQHLHLDFETFSKVDLKSVGAYRYAFDPSTEILCAAMALNDEYPVIWHKGIRQEIESGFNLYWDALENPDVLIYAHNAQFEMAICQALLYKTWGIQCPDLSRFRCTASLARRAALPAKLETLAITLGLQNLKDKKGSSLIKKFSVMQAARKPSKKNPDGLPPFRIMPEDDSKVFADFLSYCQQDVRAEREVAKCLAYFDEPINNANYSLDAVINARGVTVNLDALHHAQRIIDEETEIVSAKFRHITGFEITQNAKTLEWCNERGEDFENLQAETIEAFLDKHDPLTEFNKYGNVVVQALYLKQSVAYAAIKKVTTMLECAGPHDNRIRGMLTHHGATTGRWSASLVQFMNMKRPTIKDANGKGTSEDAYREICEGISREMLDLCYGPPLEVISSCIRHFVHDKNRIEKIDGNLTYIFGEKELPFIDADYSAIEARIVCWLAGQEDALEEYRAQDTATNKEEKNRLDRYRIMASHIFNTPVEYINQHPQRFIGKQAILLCGFQGGPAKFRQTCEKFGYKDMPFGLEDLAVKVFRKKHKQVVQYWYDAEDCAKEAILKKNTIITLDNISFLCRDIEGIPFLLIKLPSGRKLAYPKPRIIPSKKFEGNTTIVFYGHIQGQIWGEVETYGGKLVENITQAVAADVMANGAHKAESAGYEIATLIHDEAISYFKPGQTPEEFVKLLSDLPAWADGLPITAEGDLVPFYKKD